MNDRKGMFCSMIVFVVVMVVPVSATVINFEDLKCFDDVGNHYSGLDFTFARIQGTDCTGYNGVNYPPNSGQHVIYNEPGTNTIQINFASPVSRVGIWYTSYTTGTIEAYDSSDTLINSSSGGSNIGSNSYLEVSGQDIVYVILHDTGNQITYDDLEFDTENAIPEFPNMTIPVLSVIGLMFLINRGRDKIIK